MPGARGLLGLPRQGVRVPAADRPPEGLLRNRAGGRRAPAAGEDHREGADADRTLEDALPYLFTLLGIAEEAASLGADGPADPAAADAGGREAGAGARDARPALRGDLRGPPLDRLRDPGLPGGDAESAATARLLLLVDYRPGVPARLGEQDLLHAAPAGSSGGGGGPGAAGGPSGGGTSAEREALERLVLEKTEGNPFFMEEVVQTLAEEGVLAGERGRYRLERSPGELHIPATVQGVLAARIDRLPAEEKDLLQTLAVIGKEFPFGLLSEGGRGGRGGSPRAALPSPGGGVRLRAAGVSGAGVHLQARADAGGGVRIAAGGAAQADARADGAGDRGALRRRASTSTTASWRTTTAAPRTPRRRSSTCAWRESRRSSARPTRRRSISSAEGWSW